MLSKESQIQLLKMCKFADADIAKYTGDGEYNITLPELKVFTNEEADTLTANVKSAHEKAYPEIWGRKMNQKHALGLSAADARDEDKVIEAMQAKALKAANITEGEKVTSLTKDLDNLRAQIAEKDGLVNQFKGKLKEREEYDTYVSMLPNDRLKNLENDIHVTMVKKHVIVGEGGIAINPATNEPYKDNLANPRLAKDVIPEIYKKNNWVETPAAAAPPAGGTKTLGTPNGGKGAPTYNSNDLAERAKQAFPDDARQQMAYMRTEQLKVQ